MVEMAVRYAELPEPPQPMQAGGPGCCTFTSSWLMAVAKVAEKERGCPTSARTLLGLFGQFADVGIALPEQNGLLQQALVSSQCDEPALQCAPKSSDGRSLFTGVNPKSRRDGRE